MSIAKVYVEHYPEQYGPKGFWIENPTWCELEMEIRRLDRDVFPFIWCYLKPEAADTDVPEFEIIGGSGAFAVCAHIEGRACYVYNGSKGEEEIDIWISDQGAAIPEQYVVDDLEHVIAITRRFYDSASLDPEVEWRQYP